MSRYTAEELKAGQVILIDKPLTWSSFQVVKKIKYVLLHHRNLPKRFKIGHAGTLDPLASGLLVLCTGKKTKTISEIQQQKKEYTGIITIGATTPSFDMETAVDQSFSIDHITDDVLEDARKKFLGEIMQFPPVFSAIKKDGKRLYEHARAGTEVYIDARPVHIETFDIERISTNEIAFRVVCSKGTYIRSLAHDFGKEMGCGGYLSKLRRTKIGDFCVENALSPEEFEAIYKTAE